VTPLRFFQRVTWTSYRYMWCGRECAGHPPSLGVVACIEASTRKYPIIRAILELGVPRHIFSLKMSVEIYPNGDKGNGVLVYICTPSIPPNICLNLDASERKIVVRYIQILLNLSNLP
jgi:hypothetical protein